MYGNRQLALFESVEEGNFLHKRMCYMQGSILGPLAYNADTLPTKLPYLVFLNYASDCNV